MFEGKSQLNRFTATHPSVHGTKRTHSLNLVLLSISFQLLLGLLFGHLYDMRIYMATGYLVGTGQNPYIAQDLSTLFNNPLFKGITSFGYPPSWALLLELIYRVTFAVNHNFLLYNLAIKVPIIAANICLAYVVVRALKHTGVEGKNVQRAWVFMLFNPALIYFTSAWGQIDSIVALLSLLTLIFLDDEKIIGSAILLSLAISIKPITLPLLPVALIYLWGKSHQHAILFFSLSLLCLLLFCVVPFFVFGWDPSPILLNWNAHFTIVGGMSILTFFELLFDSYKLPGLWWLAGLFWIPALGLGIYSLRTGVQNFIDLLKKSLGLTLVFFLTRAWLSEPNIVLLLPLGLILASSGELNARIFTALWVIPLIFTIFNGSTPQLLFPSMPALMNNILLLPGEVHTIGLMARSIMAIPWQIAGWVTVAVCFKNINSSTRNESKWK